MCCPPSRFSIPFSVNLSFSRIVPGNAPSAPCTFGSWTTWFSSAATAGSAGKPSSYFCEMPIATVLMLLTSGFSFRCVMLAGVMVTVPYFTTYCFPS